MPACPQLARTSAYFDGALDAREHAEATAHLAGCAECAALLRDTATLDALLSQPSVQAPQPAASRAAHRWRLRTLAGAVLAAAASTALWLALPRARPPGPELAIEVPRMRAVEARFTGARFAPHRPYEPWRGERPRESISIATLAELERRGDTRDLLAALAATGDLPRARELAAQLPDDPAGNADRAALALTDGASEPALAFAYQAVRAAHVPAGGSRAGGEPDAAAIAVGWWNLALAARAQGLMRVSRAAFDEVIARGEPGWTDEARREAAALDRAISREDDELTAFEQRARAMLDGGPLLTRDDVRRYPTAARIYLLDVMRLRAGASLDELRPLAAELDAATGAPTATAALDRARAADPAVRAPLARRYRAVIARTAQPADIDRLLAALRAARPAVDDIRAGALILTGQAGRRTDELRAIVAPWHDPWFDVLVDAEQIRARWPLDDVRAERPLTDAIARCTADAWAWRCGQLMYDLADRLVALGRDQEAERWARRAVERFRTALRPLHIHVAWSLLADIHRHLGRTALARAEFDEVVRGIGPSSCDYRRFALVGQAQLAFLEDDLPGARDALARAQAETACAPALDIVAVGTAVDLARRTDDPTDLSRARAWLDTSRGAADDGYARVGALRLARGRDPAAADAVRRWIAAHAASRDPLIAGARAWGTSTLISIAGARTEWADAFASATAEHATPPPPPRAVAVSFDDGVLTAVVRAEAIFAGEQRRISLAALAATGSGTPWEASSPLVPRALTARLVGCPSIAVFARPPLHGRDDLLPADLPWAFIGDTAPHPGPRGPPSSLVVSGALPPDPSLPALAAGLFGPVSPVSPVSAVSPVSPTGADGPFTVSLTSADATPSRVLVALAHATYAELGVHGVAAPSGDDAAYLALSPERDGRYELRADTVRAAHLDRAPVVVLAACHAAAVAPYLRQRLSLPDAFLAAGASAVIAADIAIPDASSRSIFDELHRRIDAGEPVETAVAAIRAQARGDAGWAAHLMVFR